MYVEPNFRSMKALKEALAKGERVTVFSPGPFPAKQNGQEHVVGPHFPEAHRWYGTVEVKDGVVTRVIH